MWTIHWSLRQLIKRGQYLGHSILSLVRSSNFLSLCVGFRASNSFFFFDEFVAIPVSGPVLFVLVEFSVVNIDFFKKPLHLAASILVFLFIFWTNTQIKWILALFFIWALFKSRTMASETQFHYFPGVDILIEANCAFLNDSLHIGSLGPNNSSGNLKFSFVINLYFISAGVFDSLVFFALIGIIFWSLRTTLEGWCRFERPCWLVHVESWLWKWFELIGVLLLVLVHLRVEWLWLEGAAELLTLELHGWLEWRGSGCGFEWLSLDVGWRHHHLVLSLHLLLLLLKHILSLLDLDLILLLLKGQLSLLVLDGCWSWNLNFFLLLLFRNCALTIFDAESSLTLLKPTIMHVHSGQCSINNIRKCDIGISTLFFNLDLDNFSKLFEWILKISLVHFKDPIGLYFLSISAHDRVWYYFNLEGRVFQRQSPLLEENLKLLHLSGIAI